MKEDRRIYRKTMVSTIRLKGDKRQMTCGLRRSAARLLSSTFLCLLLSSSIFFLSCTPMPKDVIIQDALPPIYPDYCDVTIPANIAPLNFLLRVDCEAVEVKFGDLRINTKGNEVVFDIDDWKEMLSQYVDKEIEVTVSALINDQWIEYRHSDGWSSRTRLIPILPIV